MRAVQRSHPSSHGMHQPTDVTANPKRPRVAGLLHDYNRAATAYWCLLVLAGLAALAAAAVTLAAAPTGQIGQSLALAALATVVGMFPLRVPGSKNSIAAGDIFIFLSLLLFGPAAAVLAAATEAGACAWRSSRRWSSRIASAAAAALAMAACGHLFQALDAGLLSAGVGADAAVISASLLFAAAYFFVSPTLVTTVIYLKRWRAPTWAEWLTSFGWLGMGYLASASVASVLFLSFRQFGLSSVLVAAPMIAMFLTTLYFYFARQEAVERELSGRRGPAPG